MKGRGVVKGTDQMGTHGVFTVRAALGRPVRCQAMASDRVEGKGCAGPCKARKQY